VEKKTKVFSPFFFSHTQRLIFFSLFFLFKKKKGLKWGKKKEWRKRVIFFLLFWCIFSSIPSMVFWLKGGLGGSLFFSPRRKNKRSLPHDFYPTQKKDWCWLVWNQCQIASPFTFLERKKRVKRMALQTNVFFPQRAGKKTERKKRIFFQRHISFASPSTTSNSLNSLFKVLCKFPSRYLFAIELSLEYLALDGIYHPY